MEYGKTKQSHVRRPVSYPYLKIWCEKDKSKMIYLYAYPGTGKKDGNI